MIEKSRSPPCIITTCNFHSNFIIKLIANAHLSKTLCAVDVPSLGTAVLQKGYGMESTIALALAVVKFSCTVSPDVLIFLLKLEHAFTLVCDNVINIQDTVKEMAGKMGKITLPKMLNKVTGHMSKGMSMFSVNNWGSETQLYTTALIKKGPENTADIIESVYALLNRAPAHSTTGSSDDTDVLDPHALLW